MSAKQLFLTYVSAVRPSRAQYRQLDIILESERLLYNAALQERRDHWRWACQHACQFGRSRPDYKLDAAWFTPINGVTQFKALTQIRADDPEGYGARPLNVSRWTLDRLDQAMRGFFSRVKVGKPAGFPRFRAKKRYKSFGFAEFSGIRFDADNQRLTMKGIVGALRLAMHRPLPDGAVIKSCVFTKHGRRWIIALQCAVPVTAVHPHADAIQALDWGVETFVTLSSGRRIPNPRFGQAVRDTLDALHRAVAAAPKGSKRRKAAQKKLSKAQQKLRNQRRTFLHQESAALTRDAGIVAAEKLNAKNMTASARGTVEEPGSNVRQKGGLNREILDTAPGIFVAMLIYKAARAGGRCILVDPRNTSLLCSGCGSKVPKALSDRTHACPHCGLRLSRDHNAALNIRERARQKLLAEAA